MPRRHPRDMNSPRKRTIATISASLLVGMGGGVGAALAVDNGSSTTRVLPSPSAAAAAPVASTSGAQSVNSIYERSKQGVVDIMVTTPSGHAEGSGFVVDRQGHIVTNNHVVDGSSSFEVHFADGTRASARV